MRFIEAEDDFGSKLLNLAHVAYARRVRRAGAREVDLYDKDGACLGELVGSEDELSDRPVFPDTRGSVLVEFWTGGVSRHPVLGWRVEPTIGATPILCEDLPAVWCLEMTVGGVTQWIFPEGCTCDTFAVAEAHARGTSIPAEPAPEPA